MYSLINNFEMVHLAVGHLKEIALLNPRPNSLQFLLYKEKLRVNPTTGTSHSVIIHL